MTHLHRTYPIRTFLKGVSIARYVELCIGSDCPSVRRSVCPSVCPSVSLQCHTLTLSQNDASYDHEIFTDG